MNWETLEKEVHELAQKVDYAPDCIVGIVRGGLIPARLLSSYLGVKDMFCLTVKKTEDGRTVTTDISADLQGKKLLLVEDMLETGKSLLVAKEYLENMGAEVKTVCLYTMPISEVTPDYSLRQVEEVVRFPWE